MVAPGVASLGWEAGASGETGVWEWVYGWGSEEAFLKGAETLGDQGKS